MIHEPLGMYKYFFGIKKHACKKNGEKISEII